MKLIGLLICKLNSSSLDQFTQVTEKKKQATQQIFEHFCNAIQASGLAQKGINSKRLVENLISLLTSFISSLLSQPSTDSVISDIKKLVLWLIERVREG